MNPYINQLKTYFREHPINYCDYDVDTLMEMFYRHYSEFNPMDNKKIKDCFHEMHCLTQTLTREEWDALFCTVCTLCIEQERVAFLSGFRAGAQWILELTEG